MHLGLWELLLILCIAIILFGATRLPQIGKSMGLAVREFRRGQQEMDQAVRERINDKQ